MVNVRVAGRTSLGGGVSHTQERDLPSPDFFAEIL